MSKDRSVFVLMSSTMLVSALLSGAYRQNQAMFLTITAEKFRQYRVMLFDRGYGDYTMLASLLDDGTDFILRCSTQSFAAVRAFFASDKTEAALCIET